MGDSGKDPRRCHCRKGITGEDALAVLHLPQTEIWQLLEVTEAVRRHFKGIGSDSVPSSTPSRPLLEDCAFCAQSIRSAAPIEKYPLMEEEEIVMAPAMPKSGVRWSSPSSPPGSR